MADRRIDYADKVERRLDSRTASLSQLPWQGRPVAGSDLRELSVPDTQYVIVYRIEDEVVRIMRIWSTREQREH